MTSKIQQMLIAAGILNVNIDTMSSTHDNCVLVQQTNGADPQDFMGQKSYISYPLIQVLVRNVSSEEADKICNTAVKTLHRYTDVDVAGIILRGTPSTIGRDSLGRIEKLVTFRLIVKE